MDSPKDKLNKLCTGWSGKIDAKRKKSMEREKESQRGTERDS